MKTNRKHLTMAIISLVMVVCISVAGLLVADADYGYNGALGSSYYQVISQRKWDIAPGVTELETVLNNSMGTRRQVLHTAVVDLNNEYTQVIPGYKGMWPEEGNYGVESTSTQALNAEKLGYGNVVVATNCSLSWYTEAYYKSNPQLIGEPLGYSILNGEYYTNSRGHGAGVQTVIVINYDNHPITGEARPADMPKVWIRLASDPLTGWEEQAIPVLFGYLIKPDANGNPVNLYSEDHGSGIASRTFVGVKADGTLIITVSDGEQAPYSTGFTYFEMADYMLKMGCVIAANADGGGSTTFCSQRPGEDLKVNCSLSDGGERPTTNTILVVSTAPADGEFARATISTEYDYYTPGSTVEFSALGTDAVGTKVDIPSNVEWTLDKDMGTITNGVFVSNGTEGTVTAQMRYAGKIVGEHSITIATPDEISFDQPVVTVPFGKTVKIPVKATIGNGVYEIGLGQNDVSFSTTNAALGTFSGLNFTAVSENNAPANVTSTVTATLNMGTRPEASVQLKLGKASVVLWDFEGGQADIDQWNVINNRKNAAHWDYYLDLSLADRTNGQVHDGNYSMRLVTNGISSKDSHSEQYAWIRLGVDGQALVLENAKSVGFWMYVPEDNIQCWVQMHYMVDADGNGTFDTENVVSLMESENVYYNIDESGWHYLSMDISAFEKVALKAAQQFDKDPSDGMSGEKGEFFLAIVFHKAINNVLWQTNGSINGEYTYYFDNFTVDYSEAVDDREEPVFEKVYLDGKTPLIKREAVVTTNNILNLSVAVADASTKLDANKQEVPLYNATGLDISTAKVYVDGVKVQSTFANGVISANGIEVPDGYHRVKFEICDNAGNKAVIIRLVKVESGSERSTIHVVPDNPDLDRIYFGSVYWMNLEATAIQTIQSVHTVIDLNNVNHWELDHMVLAKGFTATYTIDKETNTATITITRTGDNDETGLAVLAKLPVRIIYFDTDIKVPGYTAKTYWTAYPFWPQDMKMDVDMGLITYTNGHTTMFSNEEFSVDTEMYTNMAGMNKTYFLEHGTTHVHTPVAVEDRESTCYEEGYTGRTYCEVCDSVVDWGTVIPVREHHYEVSENKLVCSDCGEEFHGTGLKVVDDVSYYAVNGRLISGWLTVDDDWYYFDKTTYAGLDGESVAECVDQHNKQYFVTFEFENGRLLHGAWYTTEQGKMYFYGPGAYFDSSPSEQSSMPKVIDGQTYLFNRFGYMATGITLSFTREIDNVTGANFVYYDCGEDGIATLYSGVYEDCLYIEGVRQKAYTLHLVNGNYYYVSDANKIAKNISIKFSAANLEGTDLIPGTYTFDENGVMQLQNGIYNDYLYINGVMQTAYKLVQYNGNYYYVYNANKVAKNISIKFSAANLEGTELIPGTYAFDENGIMQLQNGVYNDYLYINGVMQTAYKLVQYNGDYYYVYDANKIAKNISIRFSAANLEGTELIPGTYTFDENGVMQLQNGVYNDYLYINGALQTAYKLVQYNGDYYYVYDGNKVAKNVSLKFSAANLEGTELIPGTYEFDENGIMQLQNGVYNDYLYINGVMQTAYKLVQYNGDYYYVYDGNKVAKNVSLKFSAANLEGTELIPGTYTFDENGVMQLQNGVYDDYLYINGALQTAYKLVQYNGNYYYVYNANKIAKNISIRFSAANLEGTELIPGTYTFDENGVMQLQNGVYNDYLYINGALQTAYKLVQYNGDYYYVYDGNKVAKNVSLKFSAANLEGTELIPGTYEFDENGIMQLQNGVYNDYLYINGVMQTAYKLVQYNGDYYYVYDGNKVAKNVSLKFSAANLEGTELIPGTYAFDENGVMQIAE